MKEMSTKDLTFILLPILIFTVGFSYTLRTVFLRNQALGQIRNELDNHEKILRRRKKDTINNIYATMYHPVKSQCQGNPTRLADGTYIRKDRASTYDYIAVSRDLLEINGGKLSIGDIVKVMGAGHKNGIYQVRDTKDYDSQNGKITRSIDFLETPGTSQYTYNNVIIKIIIEK